jgi:hypothetical protein
VDQYAVVLPGGRALTLAAHQLEIIALGLGSHDPSGSGESNQLIVEALEALPPTQRADAFAVALLRFGHRQDIESIASYSRLSPWDVCRLEAAFSQALAAARATRERVAAPVG